MLCTRCKGDKPTAMFLPVPPKRNKRGFDSWCKPCHRDGTREWKDRNPSAKASQKRRNRIRAYGITPEMYAEMVSKQGGACAICCIIPDRDLDIDHCHLTGNVRGLLCSHCNKAIGMFRDNPNVLRAAISYLEGVK